MEWNLRSPILGFATKRKLGSWPSPKGSLKKGEKIKASTKKFKN